MFRRDPTNLHGGGRACLVVAGPGGLSADRAKGFTHILDCGPDPAPTAGVPVSRLAAFEPPADFRVASLHASQTLDASERVRHALEQLHGADRFDRIEFPVRGGLGLRAIQAKRAGVAFADAVLAVRLDSCGAWARETEQRWPAGFDEVETDFAERFAFEYADERMTPSDDLLAFVQKLSWRAGGVSPLSEAPSCRAGGVSPLSEAPSCRAGGVSPLSEAQEYVTIGIAHHNLGRYLPATLASLAAQTYPNLDVIVIDDGSTDAESVAAFGEMESRYPAFRFFRQSNAGIGATRNRCLERARGEFFIPVDADNLARPEMVERFVTAIRRNPDLDAMTCYFLAFEDGAGNPPRRFLHALRPAGGPHALAGIRNVYGDANAIFRTEAFRAVGGYETDRGTSCEDWEAFVKLVHAGKRIGVVPEHLFDYRHLAAGFSRRTNWFANHQRVMRQFDEVGNLPPGEGAAVWAALLGFHQKLEQLESRRRPRRHRVADAIHALVARVLRRPVPTP